jgi:hypothetical protein
VQRSNYSRAIWLTWYLYVYQRIIRRRFNAELEFSVSREDFHDTHQLHICMELDGYGKFMLRQA